ncbi:MAG: 2,3-bisphosphoglycerate-independent phosphoglycerate mutase, partial [Acidobacteria bacterium]|nr:2,3-bisphosphoglycerate-independent phosphoglycerate mutase [Acidobacteriota bacterium]
MSNERPFLILAVLDGFGLRREAEWNAMAQAATPTFKRLFEEHPWVALSASGLAVGLPEGQMGNSEVGHLNIGAGRVVDQDVIRISKAIDSHEIDHNPVLAEVFETSGKNGRAIHLVGLLSDGGVHSLQKHLHGLVDSAIRSEAVGEGGSKLYVHAILDGRDTPPRSANGYLRELVEFLDERPGASLSTVIGRYYTMDRDQRWERTQRGYDLMTLGIGTQTSDPVASIERCYESGMTDEFMEALTVLDETGAYRGNISDGDTVIFFNFRADRMRQIVSAFRNDELDGFQRAVRPHANLVSMTSYQKDFGIPVIFEPLRIAHHL